MSPLLAMSITNMQWPGHLNGYEITATELLVLMAFLATPKKGRAREKFPIRAGMLLYFLAVLVSTLISEVPKASSFYLWQVARMWLLSYLVWSSLRQDTGAVDSLYRGLGLGLMIEAAVVVWQKFALGMVQTPGTFVHQNTLGLLSHFVLMPFAISAFSGTPKKWDFVVLCAGVVTIGLTASRASIGLMFLGLTICWLISLVLSTPTIRPRLIIVALAGAVLAAPIAVASLENRFSNNPVPETEYDERAAFELAAVAMLRDNPLGVGANMFVVVANSEGYYDRAGVAAWNTSRSAHVHNFFLLTAAETGYIGVLSISLLVIGVVWRMAKEGWRIRGGHLGGQLLGVAVALTIVSLHSLYEWVLVTGTAQIFLSITLGVGLALRSRSLSGATHLQMNPYSAAAK